MKRDFLLCPVFKTGGVGDGVLDVPFCIQRCVRDAAPYRVRLLHLSLAVERFLQL